MKTLFRVSLAACVVIAVVCVAISLNRKVNQITASSAVPVANRSAELRPEPVARSIVPLTADVQKQLPLSRLAVSTSLAQALPGLTPPVVNWREYKPAKITVAPYPDTPMSLKWFRCGRKTVARSGTVATH